MTSNKLDGFKAQPSLPHRTYGCRGTNHVKLQIASPLGAITHTPYLAQLLTRPPPHPSQRYLQVQSSSALQTLATMPETEHALSHAFPL